MQLVEALSHLGSLDIIAIVVGAAAIVVPALDRVPDNLVWPGRVTAFLLFAAVVVSMATTQAETKSIALEAREQLVKVRPVGDLEPLIDEVKDLKRTIEEAKRATSEATAATERAAAVIDNAKQPRVADVWYAELGFRDEVARLARSMEACGQECAHVNGNKLECVTVSHTHAVMGVQGHDPPPHDGDARRDKLLCFLSIEPCKEFLEMSTGEAAEDGTTFSFCDSREAAGVMDRLRVWR